VFFSPLKVFRHVLSIPGAAVRVVTNLSLGEYPELIFFLGCMLYFIFYPFTPELMYFRCHFAHCLSPVLDIVYGELAV
jgi:hypothetical protein